MTVLLHWRHRGRGDVDRAAGAQADAVRQAGREGVRGPEEQGQPDLPAAPRYAAQPALFIVLLLNSHR